LPIFCTKIDIGMLTRASHWSQRQFKILQGPRTVFNVRPRAKKNMVGCGNVSDALLFITTNDDSEWKTRFCCTLKP
jgi:hypothetical protein